MAKFLGVLTFETDRCKGCNICVNACPVNILDLNKEMVNRKGYHPAYIVEPEKCIACMSCSLMCPDVVISIDKVEKGAK
jgi:2-oxoglutarate ferredoxin oxidoreductase subunit delta